MTPDVTKSMQDRTSKLSAALRQTIRDHVSEPLKMEVLTLTQGFSIVMAALAAEVVEMGRGGGLTDDEIIETLRKCMVDLPEVPDADA